MLYQTAFIDQKYSKNGNIVKKMSVVVYCGM